MVWANFLHIYQPPTQYPEITRQIAEQSYLPLVVILEQNPRAKLTLNIVASLTEQLAALGYGDLITRIARLAEKGQVELVGSAAYHALLPKLPATEMKRQIARNTEINQGFFGAVYNPKGFFPPEMAYSSEVATVVEEAGFGWLMLSEWAPASTAQRGESHDDQEEAPLHPWKISGTNLVCVIRDKALSLQVAFNRVFSLPHFEDLVRNRYGSNGAVVTAMDGETFGHHNKHQQEILAAIYQHRGDLETITITELIKRQSPTEVIALRDSSWGETDEDAKRGVPFPLWDDPDNPVHPLQWQLVALALQCQGDKQSFSSNRGDKGDEAKRGENRLLLDRALHSDQFWWASGKPYWRFDMIERGAAMLRAVVEKSSGTPDQKTQAGQLYDQIVYTAEHFKGKVIVDIPKM